MDASEQKNWRKWVNLPLRLLKKHIREMKVDAQHRREKIAELQVDVLDKEKERESLLLQQEEEERGFFERQAQELKDLRERQLKRREFVDDKIQKAQDKIRSIRGFSPERADRWKKIVRTANLCRPFRRKSIYEVLRRAFQEMYEEDWAD